MLRPVNTLKIPDSIKSKIQEIGFQHCEDIEDALKNSDSIPKHVKTLFDDYKIIEQLQSPKILSGIEVRESESSSPRVAVFHKGLDKLLNGGLPSTRITELYGGPGCGKTQLCLQFCVDVQMPSALGGTDGEALFISTDFGFRVERLREIAEACVGHCSRYATEDNKLSKLSIKSLLDGVSVVEIQGYEKLVEVIFNLNDYLEINRKTKLIIVDSFSLPLVCEVNDLIQRTKIIYDLLNFLQAVAKRYSLAVIVTNQMTTLLSANLEKKLIPSLGEGFGHRVHQRLMIDDGKIYLTKSINHPQVNTTFQITKAGIR